MQSRIIKQNVASILHYDPEINRIMLSIAQDDRGYYVVAALCVDSGPRFDTYNEALNAINHIWGSNEWDVQPVKDTHIPMSMTQIYKAQKYPGYTNSDRDDLTNENNN